MKKKNNRKKETTEKQLKVKEMIVEIQKREEEKRKEGRKEQEEEKEWTTKEKNDKLPPDTKPRLQEQNMSKIPKKIHEESARKKEEPDGRHSNLGTSILNIHGAGENKFKWKDEYIRIREKGGRKRTDFS